MKLFVCSLIIFSFSSFTWAPKKIEFNYFLFSSMDSRGTQVWLENKNICFFDVSDNVVLGMVDDEFSSLQVYREIGRTDNSTRREQTLWLDVIDQNGDTCKALIQNDFQSLVIAHLKSRNTISFLVNKPINGQVLEKY